MDWSNFKPLFLSLPANLEYLTIKFVYSPDKIGLVHSLFQIGTLLCTRLVQFEAFVFEPPMTCEILGGPVYGLVQTKVVWFIFQSSEMD